MTAYYNEIDPYAAAWLRNLIVEGLIATGDVDERSIINVRPTDLAGYTQCHFFAGIGAWSYAARLAKWPDSRPVWTGSCPCQPLSKAGRRLGAADDRYLWPVWRDLIRECRPPVIFGEQVAVGLGRAWFDEVSSDLERMDYACGALVAPAAGFGAEHIRDRLWFVADSGGTRSPRPVPDSDGSSGLVRPEELQCSDFGLSAGIFPRSDRASVLPLDGSARRVDAVRAFGNAIVPQVAAQVIGAYMEIAA
jgi:DNA (cytosine-5)-methyltransferase 1